MRRRLTAPHAQPRFVDRRHQRLDGSLGKPAAEVSCGRRVTSQLVSDGITIVPVCQGFRDMSAPTKELEKLLLSKRLQHGGNPVLRWMADNVSVREDPAGNLKPDKAKSTGRIDGIVATIVALGRAIVRCGEGEVRIWGLED